MRERWCRYGVRTPRGERVGALRRLNAGIWPRSRRRQSALDGRTRWSDDRAGLYRRYTIGAIWEGHPPKPLYNGGPVVRVGEPHRRGFIPGDVA